MTSEAQPLAYLPFTAATWRDPYPLYQRLREVDPVHRSPLGFFVLSRFADVHAAACDPKRYSSAEGLTFRNEKELLSLAPTVVMMDPPTQTLYRRLVNRGFSPRSVAPLEEELRRFVGPLVEELVEHNEGDLATGVARRVPAWVVGRYLGVPASDLSLFEGWTEAIVQNNAGQLADPAQALADLYRYFVDLVELRRRHPGDDMVTQLLQADAEGEGEGIGLEGILGYAFVMIAGGNDTTTGLLTGAAVLLTESFDERRRLLEDPTLIGPAIEELLRMTTPVQGLCRVLSAPVSLHGVTMAEGDRVLLCYGAANRDPREFGPTAERLDVTRGVRRHLAFAGGPHHCLGASAARLTARVVVEELLRRCPRFAVDADAGRFAEGPFTRRYERLPFVAHPG